jgi:6-phospho-beta-glucosidase
MARIKLAYIGGGSTRAPGTVASFLQRGENFRGSEIVLVDLDQEKLELVQTLATKMARCWGVDVRISATTDRRAAFEDCNAVLSSFRPGGFEARYLDESIPLKHGIIGQETQGPGGFFMALRAIHATKAIIEDMEQLCPNAILFNYTNPVNIVAEAVSHHSAIPVISLCEGPIFFANAVVRTAGLDPKRLDAQMAGLNHGCWTVRHLYDGQDVMPLLEAGYERARQDPEISPQRLRLLWLAVRMQTIPADYFKYYYFKDEVLQELLAKPTTRAQDILAQVPDYWAHYREQAASDHPQLDPARSRGGIYELELAFNVMAAVFNDLKEVWTVNVPNQGAIADFPADLVVEVPCYIDRHGASPIVQGHMPRQVMGLLKMLGEYQALTAEAAWNGTRSDAIRALASNPLVMSLSKAEAVYNDMAAALKDYLPERLW